MISCAANRVPFRRLSNPFQAAKVDLQARVDSAAGAAELPQALWESDEVLSVCATAVGTWNAVATWFEVRAGWSGSAGTPHTKWKLFLAVKCNRKPTRHNLSATAVYGGCC